MVIVKSPVVQIDIMVLQEYWPKLVSMIQEAGCKYDKEQWTELPTGSLYIRLENIQSEHEYQLGNLIGSLYALESDEPKDHKFYILVKTKKKVKKNDLENRSETGTGSESGDSGESSGNSGNGEDYRPGGDGDRPAVVNLDDFRGLEVLEGADDDCE